MNKIPLATAMFVAGLLCASPALFAQRTRDTVTVSRRTTPFDRYWTHPRFVPKGWLVPRIVLSSKAVFNIAAFINIRLHYSQGPYCTVDVFVDNSNLLLGPKLGYEFTAGLFGAAADFTYFIDRNYDSEGNNRNAVVFTPKVGISILGFANLFYGYQVPLSNERIGTITRNRFSLVFNLNKAIASI